MAHKYFKELNVFGNVSGLCSLEYKDKKQLEEYKSKCKCKVVEINEKEYDRLRKLIREKEGN